MNASILQVVSWVLVHSVWQGVLVAAAVALALRTLPVRLARARYAVACGGLVLVVLLPVASVPWMDPPAALAGDEAPAQLAAAAAATPTVHASRGSPEVADRLQSGLALLTSSVEENAPWLVLAWAFGVLLSSARVVAGWRSAVALTKNARPAGENWQAAVERLCRKLGVTRAVRVLASMDVDVPSTIGWLHPALLVPASALTGLSAQHLELILAHELAHIRRHDYLVNLLQTFAETLLFFHPAVWWLGTVIRAERENCCDDIAVASGATPIAYARALTSLEALRIVPSPALSALGGSLSQRVHRLVAPGARCISRWSTGASALTLVATISLAVPLATIALPRAETHESKVAVTEAPPEAPRAPAPAPRDPPAVPVPPPRLATPMLAEPPAAAVELARSGSDEDEQDEDDRDDDADARTVVGKDKLTVDQIVALHSAGVDAQSIRAAREMGFEPTVENLVNLGNAEVTRDYVKEMRERFGKPLTVEQVCELKEAGVTLGYVRELEAMGFKNLSADDVAQARAVDVTTAYVGQLKAAGVTAASLAELTQLRATGVDAKYIKDMKAEGLTDLTPGKLIELRGSGVTAEYLKGLRAP